MATVTFAAVHNHGGRIVKNTGDGLLAEFPSAFERAEGALVSGAPSFEQLQIDAFNTFQGDLVTDLSSLDATFTANFGFDFGSFGQLSTVKRHAIGTPDRHRKGTPHRRWDRLVPVANRRVPRASRSALTSDGAARVGGACLPTGASRGGTQARCLKRQLSLPVSMNSGRSVPVCRSVEGSEGSSPLGHIFVSQTCMR